MNGALVDVTQRRVDAGDQATVEWVCSPSFGLFNYSNDLFDILGFVAQTDVTSIANVGNHGSLVFNYVDNDKTINV